MFIFTTKFSRKKAIAAVLALAVVLCTIILVAGTRGGGSEEVASLSGTARNNGQRVQFLRSLGWEVDETTVDERDIVIPKTFTGIYEEYNKLQLSQGFDLSRFGGAEATRYTYRVLNYPGASADVVADIIVYRGEVIAGNIQSTAQGGFMSGLAFPQS